AIWRDEFLLKCGFDFSQQSRVGGRVLRFAEDLRSLLKQSRGPREIRRLDQVLVRCCSWIIGSSGGEGQPITIAEAAAPDVALARFTPHVFHPGLHARVLLFQNAAIPEGEIHRPWHDSRNVGPTNRTVILLIEGEILEPFGIKRGGIVIEGSGAGKDLGVSSPTQALVPLRAIRGNVEEISFLPPDNVVLKLIQQLIGSFKGTGGLNR